MAVISNGGAYLADITGSDRSLPIAYIAGLGNQADVCIAELLDVILDDERVSAVNLQFESIRDVTGLAQCAVKAHHKGVPIVALKAGKSTAGQRAARAHTASLASTTAIVSALFARLGFVEVESAGEALETLKMLTLSAAPKRPRMVLVTSSGTYAVMAADFAERNGLTVPPVSERTQAALRPLIHEFLAASNPLDIATAQFWPDEQQQEIFATFVDDDYDVAVQTMSFPPQDSWQDESWYRSAKVFANCAKSAGLPAVFVSSTHEGLPRRAREMLIELGVAPLQGFEHGMKAIAQALAWHRRRKALKAETMLLPQPPPAVLGDGSLLDEVESKALLAGFGVSIPAGRRVRARDPLPRDLPFPVVLKVCDASILHKSDVGGVSLNLLNPELLDFAREQMLVVLGRNGHEARHFLVEESIRGGIAELMVGVRGVAGIGFSLTLAIGGSAVELLNDSAHLLLPCGSDEIRQALEGLGCFRRCAAYAAAAPPTSTARWMRSRQSRRWCNPAATSSSSR